MIGDRFKSHKLIGVFTDLVMRTGVRAQRQEPAREVAEEDGRFPACFEKPQAKTA